MILNLGQIASMATTTVNYGMKQQLCRDCLQWKPRDGFSPGKSYCKPCNVKRAVAWQQKNPDKKNKTALAYFYRHHEARKAAGRKWKKEHRAQERMYQRAYRKAHPDTTTELWRQRYWERHPDKLAESKLRREQRRRARKRGVMVDVTKQQLDARWNVFGGLCWICRQTANEWDHVKPLARGGAHIPANLRPVCGHCNRVKQDQWPYRRREAA